MGLEQNNEQQYREVPDKYHDPAADYEMTTRDYVLRPIVAAVAIAVTLPSVSEAKGSFYSIKAGGNVTNGLPVTIQDKDDSEYWSDIRLTTLGDSILIYSDGLKWMNAQGIVLGASVDDSQIAIINTWGTGFNSAAILIAADNAGTALALGAVAASVIIERVNLTAEITGGNYLMGKYMTLATSESFGATGFMIGHYIRIDCAHVASSSSRRKPNPHISRAVRQ